MYCTVLYCAVDDFQTEPVKWLIIILSCNMRRNYQELGSYPSPSGVTVTQIFSIQLPQYER